MHMNCSTLQTRPHHDGLSSRACMRRTFGGMMAIIGLLLLSAGAYLIHDQFADPVESHPAGLLFAAVLIATGLILLSYLVHPGVGQKSKFVVYEILDLSPEEKIQATATPIEVTASDGLNRNDGHGELSLQKQYVDHARARP